MQLAQNRNSLPRQRHDMLLPHLHPRSWDAPFSSVQIELAPLSREQFPRADKDQRREFQREPRHRPVSLVPVNRAKQLPDRAGSTIAAKFLAFTVANAPLRSVVMSRSARPVATAYRQTRLASDRTRCA